MSCIRAILFVAVFVVFLCLFYYYNDSLHALVEIQRAKQKCQQSLDTTAAQLQVVYEHKSRLENILSDEKSNSLRFRAERDKYLVEIKLELLEYKKKLAEVSLKHESLSGRYQHEKRLSALMERKTVQMQETINRLLDDKSHLQKVNDELSRSVVLSESNKSIHLSSRSANYVQIWPNISHEVPTSNIFSVNHRFNKNTNEGGAPLSTYNVTLKKLDSTNEQGTLRKVFENIELNENEWNALPPPDLNDQLAFDDVGNPKVIDRDKPNVDKEIEEDPDAQEGGV